jgi:hypothetical protein
MQRGGRGEMQPEASGGSSSPASAEQHSISCATIWLMAALHLIQVEVGEGSGLQGEATRTGQVRQNSCYCARQL